MSEFETLSLDVVTPPGGEILLRDKLKPVCDNAPPYDEHYALTRGIIDPKPFQTKLKAMPGSLWEDEGQTSNVRMTRPAHDRWGIKKIVFNFCDDFMLKVLDFPWSQEEEWRKLLLPIYNEIGITEERIVRCLLASIPPGVKIPVHHDTGLWVKHTHRIHVAIVTSIQEVDFHVGPTPELMRKYLFDEGRIVELNNQAKHAVANNSTSNLHRVHLIFDYVDDMDLIKQRILLKPGEVLNQTRRSIDLASAVDEPCTGSSESKMESKSKMVSKAPNFIIIGAQKCGTTSMYEYICQHPLVVKGKRRETHYFDWRFNHQLAPLSTAAKSPNILNETTSIRKQQQEEEEEEKHYRAACQAHYEYYMNFYYANELRRHPSLITGESTPSYLLHGDLVIPRMRAVCPWAKVLVMLRNPVDRAYSQYQMCVDPCGTPEQLKVRGKSAYHHRRHHHHHHHHHHQLPTSTSSSCDHGDGDGDDPIESDAANISGSNGEGDQLHNIHPSSSSSSSSGVMSFEEVIRKEISELQELHITPETAFEDFAARYLHNCPMDHGGHSIVARGLYVLQLRHWMQHWPYKYANASANANATSSSSPSSIITSTPHTSCNDQLRVYSIADLKGDPEKVRSTMEDVFAYLGLPVHDIEDLGAKNTRAYDRMRPECRTLLEEFYAPFNEALWELLGRKLEW